MIQKLQRRISILQNGKEISQIIDERHAEGRVAAIPKGTGHPVERSKLAKGVVVQLRRVKHQAKVRQAGVDRIPQSDIAGTPGVQKRKLVILTKEGLVLVNGSHDDRRVKDAHGAEKSGVRGVAVAIRNVHADQTPNFV